MTPRTGTPALSAFCQRFSHVALSNRGDRLYVVTQSDWPVRVYDVDSGRLIASRRDPHVAANGASAMALSLDGSALAVATRDRVIRYDARTLQRRGAGLTGHTARVLEVAYSHDGRLLATTSEDGTALVWDGRTGDQLHRFAGGGPIGLAFADDDRRLFTAGGAGIIQAWNVAGVSRQLALGEDTSALDEEYSWSVPASDGQTVARVRAGRLWFEDTLTGETTADPAPIRGRDVELVWSSDSRWLLSRSGSFGGPDPLVTVWNASNGSASARADRFVADGAAVHARFSHDTKYVFLHDGTSLHTLNRTTLRPAYPAIALSSDANDLVPHPDGGSVFVLHRYNGSFVRVDPKTGDVLDTASGLLGSDEVHGVMSPDGTRMMVTGPGVRVRLLDVEKQTYIGMEFEWQWGAPAFAPDGTQYAIAEEGRIRLWDGRIGE